MVDGGGGIEFLEEKALTAIRWSRADGKKSQPYQPLARAGWCRFSLAVLLPPIRFGPCEPTDGANGFDFVALSRKPPAWPDPKPSGNLLN
jgi:hypothetical protein